MNTNIATGWLRSLLFLLAALVLFAAGFRASRTLSSPAETNSLAANGNTGVQASPAASGTAYSDTRTPSQQEHEGNAAAPVTPLAREQVARRRLSELTANLDEDPVSAEWAGFVESKIDAIVHKPEIFQPQIAASMTYDRECRTSGCRISFSFPAGVDADEALTMLRMELADEFSSTAMVPIWKSDGSSEQHVFLAAKGADRLLRRKPGILSPGREQGTREGG